jgi:hypothetical protein
MRLFLEKSQRPPNRRSAWWAWKDSNCLPGTQSYRTGLCEADAGGARYVKNSPGRWQVRLGAARGSLRVACLSWRPRPDHEPFHKRIILCHYYFGVGAESHRLKGFQKHVGVPHGAD